LVLLSNIYGNTNINYNLTNMPKTPKGAKSANETVARSSKKGSKVPGSAVLVVRSPNVATKPSTLSPFAKAKNAENQAKMEVDESIVVTPRVIHTTNDVVEVSQRHLTNVEQWESRTFDDATMDGDLDDIKVEDPDVKVKSTRVRLTEVEKLVLMTTVVEHMYDLRDGGLKKEYWAKIRVLLHEDVGKYLTDPRLTVKSMLHNRQKQLAAQELETGTRQPDTELTDRIDKFQGFLDELESMNKRSQAAKQQRDEERKDALAQRDDMLTGLQSVKKKRRLDEESEGEYVAEDPDVEDSSASFRKKQSRPRESVVHVQMEKSDMDLTKDDWIEVLTTAMRSSTAAFGPVGTAISQVDAPVAAVETKLSNLQGEVSKIKGYISGEMTDIKGKMDLLLQHLVPQQQPTAQQHYSYAG
jgi:hypothetical protein